jgi:hypothetical protein
MYGFDEIVKALEPEVDEQSGTEHLVLRGRNDLDNNAIDDPANNWEE